VRFKVDGITRMDGYFPHWTSVPHERTFHFNDFHRTTGERMSFYMQGGYTASFGPYAVTIPNTLSGYGPNDPRSVAQLDTADGAFYWYDVNNALRASRYDEAQLLTYNDTRPAHEAHSDQISEGGLTDWIIFRDFRMEVPSDSVILGIEAKVKRRQPNISNDAIFPNFGVKRPDIASGFKTLPIGETDDAFRLPDNFVLEHMATVETPGNAANVTSSHILDDVDFGRFLDLTAGVTGSDAAISGRLSMDLTGVGNDGSIRGHDSPISSLVQTPLWTGDEFTMATWIRCPTPLSSYTLTQARVLSASAFNLFPNTLYDTSFSQTIIVRCNLNSVTNQISNYNALFQFSGGSGSGSSTCTHTANFDTSTVNTWHHIVVTWSRKNTLPGGDGTHLLYVDGQLQASGVTSGGWRADRFQPAHMNLAVGTPAQGSAGANQGSSIFSMAHVAVWDVALSPDEIVELYRAKGRVDYRHNFGDYSSSSQLNHYFLVFPEQIDIRDHQVCLVDQTGIRTDLENKAITTESWPQLGTFFYTDARQYGFLPLAVSDGPTHDNHTAIGYQPYGGEIDTWGGTFTPGQVNNFYFGVAIRATNEISLGYRGDAFIDHAKLTVFTRPRFDRTVNVRVEVAASNQFYLEREIFGGIMNLIELGEKLQDA